MNDDDLALLALGVLPEAEARALAEQIARDPRALAAYRELRESADALALATDDASLSAGDAARMKRALLAQIQPAAPNGTASNVHAITTAPSRRAPLRASVLGFATAAAVLIAVFAGLDDMRMHEVAQRATQTADRAAANASQERIAAENAERALGSIVADSNSKHYTISNGSVVAGRGGIVLALLKLPALPAGRVYQAWTLARGAKAMTPSVTFTPDTRGAAVVDVPVDASGLVAVAVSVEPEGGSLAPTTHPTFVRPLS